MNIKKFGKRLSKINMLFDSIKEDGDVSAMEKDLLLSYLREAYEYVLDGKASTVFPADVSTPKTYTQQPIVQETKPEPAHEQVLANIVSSEVVTPTVPTPEPVVVREAVAVAAAPMVTTPVIEQKEEVAVEELPTSLPLDDIPAELAEIFDSGLNGDLGDKLSMSPINDMTKSMGINEKIFTITELFGGDNDIFNTIVRRINELDTYQEAKAYLATGIAKDQNWAHADKIKKADKFIKLVKRRFA